MQIHFNYFLSLFVITNIFTLGGYSQTIAIWVCAAQQGRDFGASDLEYGIYFRDVS